MMSASHATQSWSRRGGIDRKINGGTVSATKLGRASTDVSIGGGNEHEFIKGKIWALTKQSVIMNSKAGLWHDSR